MAETDKPRDPVPVLAPASQRSTIAARLWRLPRRLRWGVIGAGLAALAATALVCPAKQQDCRAASRTATDAIAITVCQRELDDSHEPRTAALLADAHRRAGNLEVASALATGLLATPARADALQILGKIAAKQARLDEATEALERARDLHRAENRRADLAKDDQALAGILTRRQHYPEALRILDECIAESRTTDRMIEGYCHLSAAQVLWRVGYFDASQQELDRAAPLLTTPRDHAWLETQRGTLLQDRAHSPIPSAQFKLSVLAFQRALELTARAQLPELALTSEINLAYSLAEDGRPDEAERHLEAAHSLDRTNAYASQRAQLAARIAFRRGNLLLASSLNDRLYDTIGSDDERLEVSAMQARIALASNDLALAEQWARRGIAQAENVRAKQSVLELRAWVLSRRRAPYELLFTALARAGKLEAALAVFDQWQGRSLLDAVSRPRSSKPLELRGAARQLDKLGVWFPAASAAPVMRSDEVDAPIADLVSTDVFALVIAEARLWCITAHGGALRMADLGPFEAWKDRLDAFKSKPTDVALGDELGELLLRDDTYRKTRDTLRVVLDGPLSGLPVAALRRRGAPLIAVRPIVHALRMAELACVPAGDRSRNAIVLADPRGDLPGARREAAIVAALLGTTSVVGDQATSQALFGASGGDVLHVAAHADIETGGGVLALYDQAVSALEIAARRLGPALVVLSACDSALSHDAELAGALSTAFLASGSAQVIATLRPISDLGARELTTRFYRDGGVRDPVRVLAQIQASLIDTDNTDWPSFAVFGHDICEPPS